MVINARIEPSYRVVLEDHGPRRQHSSPLLGVAPRNFYAHDPFGNPLCFVDASTVFKG